MLGDKELATLQPLLHRLTGQVTWCLFDEYDVPPEQTDAFMDVYQRWRAQTLELCRRIARGEAGRRLILTASAEVIVDDAGSAPQPGDAIPCPDCRRLQGRSIQLPQRSDFDDEEAFDDAVRNVLPLLPPYSLGCRLRAQPTEDTSGAPITAEDIPPSRLHCSDGWLFSRTWSRT